MKIAKYGSPSTPSGYPQITLRDPHTIQEGIHDIVRRLGMTKDSATGDAILSGLVITEDSGTGTFTSTAGVITTQEGYLLEVAATSGSYNGTFGYSLRYWVKVTATAIASIPTATGGNVERHFQLTAELIPATSTTVIPADCRLLSDYARGIETIDNNFLRFGDGVLTGSAMSTMTNRTYIKDGVLHLNLSAVLVTGPTPGSFQIFLPSKCKLFFTGWIVGSDSGGSLKQLYMEPHTNNSYKISGVAAGDRVTINLSLPTSF